MEVSFQRVTYSISGRDVQGQLVFLDNRLAAALVLLEGDAYLPRHQGLWNLEAGFGCCDPLLRSEPFKSLDEAASWVVDQSQPRLPCTVRREKGAVPQSGANTASSPSPCPGKGNENGMDGSL